MVIILALIVGGVVLYRRGAVRQPGTTIESSPLLGQQLPELTTSDLAGKAVTLSQFYNQDKLVLVNFWASWCPFCLAEMPDLAKLQEEFRDSLHVIAVNRGEKAETARAFAQAVGVETSFPIILDRKDELYNRLQNVGMPVTIITDPAGTIRFHRQSQLSLTEMRAVVRKLLTESALQER